MILEFQIARQRVRVKNLWEAHRDPFGCPIMPSDWIIMNFGLSERLKREDYMPTFRLRFNGEQLRGRCELLLWDGHFHLEARQHLNEPAGIIVAPVFRLIELP